MWTEGGLKFFLIFNEHIPHDNLELMVEYVLCCPGTNPANDYWSREKSLLSVKTLTSVLTVKLNLRNVNCSDICVCSIGRRFSIIKKDSYNRKI